MADKFREPWDGGRLGHLQTIAEVVPKANGVLGAGFHEPEERIAAVAPGIGSCAGRDFAPRYLTADIVFRTVGVQRDLRPRQHRQQVLFPGVEPRQQPVKGGEARRGGEDAAEPAPQLTGAARGWRLTIGLEVGIEPPYAVADEFLGPDVRLAERIELVDQLYKPGLYLTVSVWMGGRV